MTSIRTRAAILALGLAAMTQHQIAYAQASAEKCIAQADVSDAVVYAMPILTAGMRSKCGDTLSPGGFMATQGDAFVAPYAERQTAAWPGALRMLSQFGDSGAEAGEMMAMFQSLPADTVRPLFDAIIEQKIAEEIKLTDCGKIERAVELLAPLPPENVSGIVTFLLDVTKVDNPKICPADK